MTERYNDDMQNERIELLKDYLKRLGKGEALEAVRADFMQNFKDVDASEIMQAEQQMIQEGTPITEVQKLCDVHSALFHGETREEKIANAEKAVDTASFSSLVTASFCFFTRSLYSLYVFKNLSSSSLLALCSRR